jgi:hypothetical protein
MSHFCVNLPPASRKKNRGGVIWTNSGQSKQWIDQQRISQQCQCQCVLQWLLKIHSLCCVQQGNDPSYHRAPFQLVMVCQAKEVSKNPNGVWSETIGKDLPLSDSTTQMHFTPTLLCFGLTMDMSTPTERKEDEKWQQYESDECCVSWKMWHWKCMHWIL